MPREGDSDNDDLQPPPRKTRGGRIVVNTEDNQKYEENIQY